MTRLQSLGLTSGGAILLDQATSYPLPIEPSRFLDQADAEAFIAWLGEHDCGIESLREHARRWRFTRVSVPCPRCPARMPAGAKCCEECALDDDRRFGDHLAEPGRNATEETLYVD